MTDTMEQSDATEINISVSALQAIYDQIVEKDEQLAAASGSSEMGKRAYANTLVNEHGEQFEKFVNDIVTPITNVNDQPELLVAVVTMLQNKIKEAFGKPVDEFLTKYVEENKKDQPEVSDAQVEELTKQAKELRKQYAVLRPTLEMFGQDVSTVPEPKKMTGSRGPRGPRTLSSFDYSVDGKPRSETQNSLSSIANTVFKDTPFGNTKALREELARQGLNLQEPADEWSYTVKVDDNKSVVISAVKTAEKDEYSKTDDDDEETTEPENDDSVV